MALDRILAYGNTAYRPDSKIMAAESSRNGTSLAQVQALSDAVGLHFQMAYRPAGAIPVVPAVVHWKAGHFAALVAGSGERYLVQDPTFGGELWVSRKALDEEASGYVLVPQGPLPARWRPVSAEESATVWGKGYTYDNNNQYQTSTEVTQGGSAGGPPGTCEPMAQYRIHSMIVALNITDEPVGYSPPVGGSVAFQVSYHQREVFQPQVPAYGNLGPKWTYDWLAFVEDNPDPTHLNDPVNAYLRLGGQETYAVNPATGLYAPHARSRAVVVRTSQTPITYERRLPDGSIELYAQSDNAPAVPRKVYLTSWADPQGNTVSLSYDRLKVTGVTDAIGQVTTISYDLPGDPLKITKVTDPYARFATFEYNGQGQLQKITDVIGIASNFTYGTGDFITDLITPYGTTHFATGIGPAAQLRWIEATDPLDAVERVEFRHVAPGIGDSESPAPVGIPIHNGNLALRNTFFWSKRASALDPRHRDYKKAVLIHWLHDAGLGPASGIKESEKQPLERRVWYSYPQQGAPYMAGGFTAAPAMVARVLDDGTTQLYQYEYNSSGKVCKVTDALGRETRYTYGANNVADAVCTGGSGIALLKVEQKNGANYDLLETRTYNSQQQPLTVTDASGQTTTYTYLPDGRLQTEVTPPRSGLTAAERTTTYAYYPDNAPTGPGLLQTVTGPSTPQGSPVTSYTYDGYSRVRTASDPDGYALTYDYDALDRPTKTTYTDATYEETIYSRLDAEKQRDRLGHWTHTFHDALRRPVAIRDPLGQTATLQWCTCGSLEKVIDPNGNATSWERDAQGRVIRAVRANGTDATLTYENTTSRPLQFRDPKQQLATIQYFADNNWKQVSYSNTTQPSPTVSFTYDPVYDRLATMTDGTGTTTYGFNPVTAIPAFGVARLGSVDGPLANDLIAYTYDELGRVSGRSINGAVLEQSYDALGRITGETNALGAFTRGYEGVTDRLANLGHPNGQTITLGYFGNAQDHRLQDLHNRLAGGATLSRFQYTYAANGAITSWNQQTDNNPGKAYDLGHDAVDQLMTATLRTTDPTPAILRRYRYSYDKAENRTGEQIDDASTAASHNTFNALTALQPAGALRLAGALNESASVTVQGKPAQVTPSNQFAGSASVPSGISTVAVVATDPSGNTRTNTYQVTESGSTKTLTYDSNGSLTSDGTRTFEWDGANRLTAVNQGTHRSEFTYDGWSHRVRIVEKDNSAVTSDRRFLWCGMIICEERDGTGGAVTRRLFDQGMQEGGAAFFYARDHLGSVRELTDAAGATRARYDYDPYGRVTKLSGDKESVFGFTGHFSHGPSGLALAPLRAYDPTLGRWISEDPIAFDGGLNFYTYVHGRPVDSSDPLGLLAPGVFLPGAPALVFIAAAAMVWVWTHPPTPPPDPQDGAGSGTALNPQPTPPAQTGPTTQPTSVPTPTVVPPSPTISPTCEPEDPCKRIREECMKTCTIVAAAQPHLVRQQAYDACMTKCVRLRGLKWGCKY
jgi:RHS repeat-associated protein